MKNLKLSDASKKILCGIGILVLIIGLAYFYMPTKKGGNIIEGLTLTQLDDTEFTNPPPISGYIKITGLDAVNGNISSVAEKTLGDVLSLCDDNNN